MKLSRELVDYLRRYDQELSVDATAAVRLSMGGLRTIAAVLDAAVAYAEADYRYKAERGTVVERGAAFVDLTHTQQDLLALIEVPGE